MSEQFSSSEANESKPVENSDELAPRKFIEVNVAPGIYEVYDEESGELIDISYSEDE